MDLTPIARIVFAKRVKEARSWRGREKEIQQKLLYRLLSKAKETSFGKDNGFEHILHSSNIVETFSEEVPLRGYEDFRSYVMRMVDGEENVLWPGRCFNFAKSSGTTGGPSKYIPVTTDSLRDNHYKGASYSVALYLASNPQSRLFSGKGLILGGSFSNNVDGIQKRTEIGDLSATLIERINPFANFFRTPDKKTSLLEDWEVKLPLLAQKAAYTNITNISGVPSWMMRVLLKVLEIRGASTLKDVWPNLEVFFHGGISFVPYKAEYEHLCAGLDMHWSEVYNASEGYFSVGDGTGAAGMLLLADAGIYYEFKPLGKSEAVGIDDLQLGRVYELIISSCNGLWRYCTGDTVRVEALDPLRISVVGRTKSFINAFGEELMESNADAAIASACRQTGASIKNYTASPVYAHGNERGRHQWIIEWKRTPASESDFAAVLDRELRKVNSDYDAKRSHDIFLDMPEIVTARHGLFDKWLSISGSGKLGGQRKIPRLNNTREISDKLLELNKQ